MSRWAVGLLMLLLTAAASRADDPVALHERVKIDRDRLIFKEIKDRRGFQSVDENRGEYEACNSVLRQARDFTPDELLQVARRDVLFKDFFYDSDGFRLELVYLDGRLKQLRRSTPSKELAAAGVTDLYEGWLFPMGEDDPVVVLVTELPPGLQAQADLRQEMDVPAAVAGYYFKLFRYESRKPDKKDPSRNQERLAPLLMGRTLTVLPDPAAGVVDGWRSLFLPAVLGGFGGLAVMIVGLNWWFRRGDQAVRAQVEARRQVNPFETE